MHYSHSPEEIRSTQKRYMIVFLALAALTGVTVGISYLHLPFHIAVVLALFVASVKGSLVAAFFMHLASERTVIYSILILTALFFFLLLVTPAMA